MRIIKAATVMILLSLVAVAPVVAASSQVPVPAGFVRAEVNSTPPIDQYAWKRDDAWLTIYVMGYTYDPSPAILVHRITKNNGARNVVGPTKFTICGRAGWVTDYQLPRANPSRSVRLIDVNLNGHHYSVTYSRLQGESIPNDVSMFLTSYCGQTP